MSRAVQDQFIDDDEEETCPLCVEEFDLSDRNFRPCPCGYQVRLVFAYTTSSLCYADMMIDMPVLLQQHQDYHEWALPRMSAAL